MLNGKEKASVFISYSRKDAAFAERLRIALDEQGFRAFLDKHDILPGEPWQKRLAGLIATADCVVFLLTPDSVNSPVCDWEVNEAERLGKRILPVVARAPDPDKTPGRLRRLNYIFMRGDAEMKRETATLTSAILTDIDWVREHTRIGEAADRWAHGDRTANRARLLRGTELEAAERWIADRPASAPEPTDDQRHFVAASRVATSRRQRLTVTAVTLVAVAGVTLSAIAWWQRGIATEQRDRALVAQSRFLASAAGRFSRNNEHVNALLVSAEALPDTLEARPRPYDPAPVQAINTALAGNMERIVLPRGGGWSDAAVFTPDGNHVITSGDSDEGLVQIWSVASGTLEREVAGFGIAVLSPDQRTLLTGGDTLGSVRLWDWHNPLAAPLTLMPPPFTRGDHRKGVVSAAFSPDGRRVAAVWDAEVAALWDTGTGRLVAALPLGEWSRGSQYDKDGINIPPRVTFNAAGDRVLTLTRTARLWDASTGAKIASLGGANCGAFTPDGTGVVTAWGGGEIRLWDATTGLLTKDDFARGTHAILAVAVSPDGKRVATGNIRGNIGVWELDKTVASGDKPWRDFSHGSRVLSLQFSADGRGLLSASRDLEARENAAIVWDVDAGRMAKSLNAHLDAVVHARFNLDDSLIATQSADGTTRLWSMPPGKHGTRIPVTGSGQLVDVMFDRSGERIIALDSEHRVTVVDSEAPFRKTVIYSSAPPVTNLPTDEDRITPGRLFRIYSGETLLLAQRSWVQLPADALDLAQLPAQPGGIARVFAVHRLAPLLARLRDGRIVHLTRGGKPLLGLLASPDGSHVAAAVSAVERSVVVVGQNGNAKEAPFETEMGEPRLTDAGLLLGPGAGDGLDPDAEIREDSPTGDRYAIATRSGDAMLHDTATGSRIALLKGLPCDYERCINRNNGKKPFGAKFSKDGRYVVTSSDYTAARVYEAETGALLTELGSSETVHAEFNPVGDRVLTSALDQDVWLWPFIPKVEDLLKHAKTVAPRCLSRREREGVFLDDSPPAWCVTMRKWPYHTAAWQAWLEAKTRGEEIPRPQLRY